MEPQESSAVGSADNEIAPRKVLRMVLGYQISGVVYVIARLGIADLLVDGPRSATELADSTSVHPDALLRLMRVGVSLGLFDQVAPGSFAINELSQCLRSDAHSVYGVALAGGKTAHTRPVEHLLTAVTENRSVVKDALGKENWEYWDSDPDTKAAMTEHLIEVNAAIGPAIREHYDLSRFGRIVDVGGNEGFFLAHLLAAAPNATGVLFDRPEVMDDARKTMAAQGLAGRVEFVGGSFLDGVPPGGDLYVLKGILHDSSNDAAAQILSHCHAAAAPGSTLIAVEGILSDTPPFDPIVHLIDINMLLMVNGRERTLSEFTELFDAAGYDVVRTVALPSTGYWPFHVIEGRRR
jgi:predicted O-methyltransferase YrrM